jgi:xanthine dehydrogenase accessory factor
LILLCKKKVTVREFVNTLRTWLEDEEKIALATVVKLKGSSLRPVGSQMAMTASGKMAGSVSGGCVAGAVLQQAEKVLADAHPARLHYEPGDEDGWQVGLSCGGTVDVYVEAFSGLHRRWLQAMQGEDTCALLTSLESNLHALVWPDGRWEGDETLITILPDSFDELNTGIFETSLGEVFCQVFSTSATLHIVGAVHIAARLVELAQALDFRTRVIDARAAFANQDRFPQADEIVQAWPQEALSPEDLPPQDAVVVLTHDAKFDVPALEIALNSDVGYIGLLGSKKTQQKRKQALREKGFSASALARIHGPVGLKIGAKTPAEIAVSILAEIIAVQRGMEKS